MRTRRVTEKERGDEIIKLQKKNLHTHNTVYCKTKPNSLLKTEIKTQFSETQKLKPSPSPQNQNPKLRWERSQRSEVPFSRNLRFSHTMATDSSDQLNLNPTTTTKENPIQTLDDDTTTIAVTPTRSPRRIRRGRTIRWGFRLAFCNRRRFRCEVRRGFEEFVRRQESTIYMEIEIERGDEARGMKKETEKEAKSDHRNHKHIERKIYGPSTLVNFFKIWLWNVTFIWVSYWIALDWFVFVSGF